MIELINFRHWQGMQDEHNLYYLTLNKQYSSVNTLDTEVLAEFKEVLDLIAATNILPRALIIQSGKKNGFAAGADIQQFKQLSTYEQAFELIDSAQQIFKQLATLPIPTLAVIRGFCLGGGLELALACRYRVAVCDPKTKLGLPEVKLGLHPGWGGTVRLPRLIGPFRAFDLILSGRTISCFEAYKMGVVDANVPEWHLSRAIEYFALQEPSVKSTRFTTSMLATLSNWGLIRSWLGKKLERKISSKVNRVHYPAPFAVIQNWIEYGFTSEEALLQETKSIAQLIVGDTSRNLVRVFLLQEKLKSNHRNVSHPEQIGVQIIGAGVMGGDIAAFSALKGMRVSLQDIDTTNIAKSLQRANALFKKHLQLPHLVQAAKDRITPDPFGLGLKKATVIIEAVVEKLSVKQTVFSVIEKLSKPDALLATNTSTLVLSSIANYLQNHSRLVGIHFFNPVAKMPLVEIVFDPETSEEAIEKGLSFVRALDKLPLKVKSSPGFLVNRVLMPYFLESIQMLGEGILASVIDQAAVDFGMPMGPIELMDTVGLDVCLDALVGLQSIIPDNVPTIIVELVEQKHLGKKTGRGFYQYHNNKPVKKRIEADYRLPDDLVDRLILRMVNEAMACLREGIVADSDHLDAGMIFGVGFPAWTGGPIHYAREQGFQLMRERLEYLAELYGIRFKCDAAWDSLEDERS